MTAAGWVRIVRDIVYHEVFTEKPAYYLKFWIYAICTARWSGERRGSLRETVRELAEILGVGRSQVSVMLKWFEDEGMIRRDLANYTARGKRRTSITIVNYPQYQDLRDRHVGAPDEDRTKTGRRPDEDRTFQKQGVRREQGERIHPTNTRAREELTQTRNLRQYLNGSGYIVDTLSEVMGSDSWSIMVWGTYRPECEGMPQYPLASVPEDQRPTVLASALAVVASQANGRTKVDSVWLRRIVEREVRSFHTSTTFEPKTAERTVTGAELMRRARAEREAREGAEQ